MGQLNDIPNVRHWHSLVQKAERGFEHFQWEDFHIFFDPIFYNTHGIDKKGFYRRIFQVPFLLALFGDDDTDTGTYDKDLNPIILPRYHVIARQMVDMMMTQDPESILAYLDSVPTAWEIRLPANGMHAVPKAKRMTKKKAVTEKP